MKNTYKLKQPGNCRPHRTENRAWVELGTKKKHTPGDVLFFVQMCKHQVIPLFFRRWLSARRVLGYSYLIQFR